MEYNEAAKTQCLEQPKWHMPSPFALQHSSQPHMSSAPCTNVGSGSSESPEQGTTRVPAFPLHDSFATDALTKSERQDADWARLTPASTSSPDGLSLSPSSSDYGPGPGSGTSAYTLGSLTGSWRGTLLVSSVSSSPGLSYYYPFPHASFVSYSVGRSVVLYRNRNFGAGVLADHGHPNVARTRVLLAFRLLISRLPLVLPLVGTP